MTERKQKDNNSGPMIITALVMVLLFCGFGFLLVLQGQGIPNVEEVHAQARLKNLADLNSENQKVLTQYRWIDKSKGVVGIPIERAMDLTLVQLQSNKPHPAGPVNSPAASQPQGTPTPSPNSQKPAGQQ
jgi:hypothetical protein